MRSANGRVARQGRRLGPQSRAAITSTDVGETLKQLGFAAVIEAKSGRMDFDMNWIGAPTAEALEAATGHVQVALDKGQIVGLKPGAGRVLGLASLAELPRRLALDFSDLTDKGFAFDTVRGDFDLHDGSAYTDDVLVKGPAAEIGLIGRVGLKNEDYDQTAVVTGNVGSSPCRWPAFAAGPVIGGAVLAVHAGVQTAAEGSGARVLSNHRQLGTIQRSNESRARTPPRRPQRRRNNEHQ